MSAPRRPSTFRTISGSSPGSAFVRARNASVAEVMRDALEDKKVAALREAIDEGLAELDAGLGVEGTPQELMAEYPR